MFKCKPFILNILCVAAVLLLLLPFALDIYRSKTAEEKIADIESHVDASNVFIIDMAGLLSDGEEAALAAAMLPVTAFCPAAFVSTDDTGEMFTYSYARWAFGELFEGGNGVLFLVDMHNRYLYLYTGENNTKLSAAKCDSITDNVYAYASREEYDECASEAFRQVYLVMADLSIPQPMKHMSNGLIALCASLFVMFLIAHRKTKIKAPRDVYQLDENTQKNIQTDHMVLNPTHTYTYKNSSSSSSSGSGGGGGGGGGHGGGHRF